MTIQYGNTLCRYKIYTHSQVSIVIHVRKLSVIDIANLVWASPPSGRCIVLKRVYVIRKNKYWWQQSTSSCTTLNEGMQNWDK